MDGYNICGENWNMIGSLMEFYDRLLKTKNHPGFITEIKDTEYTAWYNVFQTDRIEENLKKILINLYRGDKYRVWGFKEIRIGLSGYDKLFLTLNNLKKLFPETKYVFLYREDINSQIKSAWWAENEEESRKLLKDQLISFKKYNKKFPEFTHFLSMEDMLCMNDNFKRLFKLLGEKTETDKIKSILKNKIDYTTELANSGKKPNLIPQPEYRIKLHSVIGKIH